MGKKLSTHTLTKVKQSLNNQINSLLMEPEIRLQQWMPSTEEQLTDGGFAPHFAQSTSHAPSSPPSAPSDWPLQLTEMN